MSWDWQGILKDQVPLYYF